MIAAPLHPREDERIATLRRYDILDTAAEARYDDLARIAARLCGTPIALVSLIDTERQWFKSHIGLDTPQTPRDIAFCSHAILGDDLFEVPDTSADERFHDNPLVTGEPGIRAYTGAPLVTREGLPLGTLCVIDRTPHTLDDEQRHMLWALARQVVAQMELHESATRNIDLATMLQQLLNATPEGICAYDSSGATMLVNDAATSMLGWPSAPLGISVETFLTGLEDDADATSAAMPFREVLADGIGRHVVEARFRRRDGITLPVEYTCFALGQRTPARGAVVMFRDTAHRRDAQAELTRLNRELVAASRAAGMAEVAAGVLHNVGNSLNSLNISAEYVLERARQFDASLLSRAAARIAQLSGDVEKHRGELRSLGHYIAAFAKDLSGRRRELLDELHRITGAVEHIKSIVGLQQSHANPSPAVEEIDIEGVIDDVLAITGADSHPVEVEHPVEPLPTVRLDRSRLVQILVNLVHNGLDALTASKTASKRLRIQTSVTEEGAIRVAVNDNGIGIAPDLKPRLFHFGFTTKPRGHGFGLHASALMAQEMGLVLECCSAGPNQGATFYIDIPPQSPKSPA